MFVVNSTLNVAVRKSEVIGFEIQPYSKEIEEGVETGYYLLVKMARTYDPDVVFEQSETLEGIRALATTFLTAVQS